MSIAPRILLHFRFNLQTKIIGLAITGTLLSGCLVGVIMIMNSRKALFDTILENHFTIANLTADFSSNYIENTKNNAHQYANRRLLINAVISHDIKEAERHLSQLLQSDKRFDTVSLYSTSGIGWASGVTNWKNRGGTVADRDWFRQVMATGKPFLGVPVISRGTGKASIGYGIPIVDGNGKIYSVMVAAISLPILSDSLTKLHGNVASRVSLIDVRNSGVIIANSDLLKILHPVAAENPAVKQALAGKHGTMVSRGNSGMELAAFAPVKGVPWSVLILEPAEHAYVPVASMINRALIYIPITLIFTALFGFFLSRTIINSIRQLVTGAGEIGKGNLQYRIPVKSRDEIGHLASSFNHMAEDLQTISTSRNELDKEIFERKNAEELLREVNENLEQRVLQRTAELTESEERFRQLAEASFEAIIIHEGGVLLQANDQYIKLFGYNLEEMLGKQALPLTTAPESLEILKTQICSGDIGPYVAKGLRKDGTTFPMEIRARNIDYKGRTVRVAAIMDITLRMQAEMELRQRTAQLEASNKELEAFSYSVSHDLRAPLRHISGYVELLINRFRSALSDKGQHYLDSIADSAHQMGLLIDNLLQFSRTGRAEMHRSDTNMNEIVQEVIESLRKDNSDRSIVWTTDNLPSVVCDSAMLRLVWENLLSNAVKFTRKREKALIEVGARIDANEAVYFVRDNGAGFDMQYAQKLFGVFQRLHATEDFEGTGIGLANVKRIILRHGGRTWAEAEPDKGATFYFSIPHN